MNDFIIKTDEESYLAKDKNNRIYLTENINEALKGSPLANWLYRIINEI